MKTIAEILANARTKEGTQRKDESINGNASCINTIAGSGEKYLSYMWQGYSIFWGGEAGAQGQLRQFLV